MDDSRLSGMKWWSNKLIIQRWHLLRSICLILRFKLTSWNGNTSEIVPSLLFNRFIEDMSKGRSIKSYIMSISQQWRKFRQSYEGFYNVWEIEDSWENFFEQMEKNIYFTLKKKFCNKNQAKWYKEVLNYGFRELEQRWSNEKRKLWSELIGLVI